MSIARFSDFSKKNNPNTGDFIVGHENSSFMDEKKYSIKDLFSLYSSTDQEIEGKRIFRDIEYAGGLINLEDIDGIDQKVRNLINQNPIQFIGDIDGLTTPRAWINEIHYDNRCQDMHEFVEICGHTGIDPRRLKIIHYRSDGYMARVSDFCDKNGCSDPFPYIVSLTGEKFENQIGDFGFEAVEMSGLSNDYDYGFALVYDYNQTGEQVIQLISYEGSGKQISFVGKDGPASGMRSHDIIVHQDPDTMNITCENLRTLQLFGTGNRYSDFEWRFPTEEQTETSGYVNHDQGFTPIHTESGREIFESRLGINTNDPLDTLHVKGGVTAEGNLLIYGPDSGHYGDHRKTIVRIENLPSENDFHEIPPNSLYRSGDHLMIKPTKIIH